MRKNGIQLSAGIFRVLRIKADTVKVLKETALFFHPRVYGFCFSSLPRVPDLLPASSRFLGQHTQAPEERIQEISHPLPFPGVQTMTCSFYLSQLHHHVSKYMEEANDGVPQPAVS